MAKKERVLGTTMRGKRKIRSQRQMNWMHRNRIDHTHITKRGRKVRHTY